MYDWAPWLYFLWSVVVRMMLFPVVLPVRCYEAIKKKVA